MLVGIFSKRFGTPVTGAGSGTEHEFRCAYEAFRKNGRPQMMIYFNQEAHTPLSRDELKQWDQVLEFSEQFPAEGLWWPYKGSSEFERLLRRHLVSFLRENFPISPRERSKPLASQREGREYFSIQNKLIEEYTRSFVGRIQAKQAFGRFLEEQTRGYFLFRAGPDRVRPPYPANLSRQP